MRGRDFLLFSNNKKSKINKQKVLNDFTKYGLDKESAEALKRAYEMSKKTIKIDIGDESQERKTLAISFARELKNLDNEQIADILSIFKEKED